MKTQVIFSVPVYREVNQLADLLYSPDESIIQLETEHEWVTQVWMVSCLAKYPTLPYRWWYREGGRLVKDPALFSVPAQPHQTLRFRLLGANDRVEFLQQKIQEVYGLTLDSGMIQQTLVWQARYVPANQVLAESIRVIQRAIQRSRMIDHGELELRHIAAVIGDWQDVTLSMATLPDYLRSYVVGQDEAIQTFVGKHEEARVFMLAGPPNSGRTRFATAYASWLNGAARFCVPVDLAEENNAYTDLVTSYPDTIFLVKNVEKYPDRLRPLLQRQARVMMLFDMLDETPSCEELPSLEAILYHREVPMLEKTFSDMRLDKLKQRLPERILQQAIPLFFSPLSDEVRRLHIRRVLAKQLADWSSVCQVPLYFQEEVLGYLLSAWQEIDAYLSRQVFPLFQRVLAHNVLEASQALQLQLSETGALLMVTVVDKRKKC